MSVHVLPNCTRSKLIVRKVSHAMSDVWPCPILHKHPAAWILVRIVDCKFRDARIEFRLQHIQVPGHIHCRRPPIFFVKVSYFADTVQQVLRPCDDC